MSNLNQFMSKAFPLGASITATRISDLFTAEDGSVWMSNSPASGIAYSSDYASCPDEMKSPHPFLPGPRNGLWYSTTTSLAYNSASGILLYSASGDGEATNGFSYYTSTNGGVTWTRRTFPNNKTYVVYYVSGKFVGMAAGTTTNGVITSTDGVTWSSVTSVNMSSSPIEAVAGAGSIVFLPLSGSTGQYSTDGGSTWTSLSCVTTSGSGNGAITWNAGAGLFITPVASSGQYQTSPTGATWTTRATQPTYSGYGLFFGSNTKFASNATVTVAFGVSGFFATSTDGLTWSNHGFVSNSLGLNTSANAAYHDGTYFVVVYSGRIFYSPDGVNWTEGRNLASGTVIASGGRLFNTLVPSAVGKMQWVSDVTATTPQVIVPPSASIRTGTQATFYRIK